MKSDTRQKINPEKISTAVAHYMVPTGFCGLGLFGLNFVIKKDIPLLENATMFFWYLAMGIFFFGGLIFMFWLLTYHIKQVENWLEKKHVGKGKAAKAVILIKLFAFIMLVCFLGLFALIAGLIKMG